MANPALEYSALAAVAAVVREGSFERAAKTLGITPSAVSQRVKAIEERIGGVLILRTNPCYPTLVGARLCAHFEQVRLLEESLIGGFPDLFVDHPTHAPTIRIAVNGDSLSTWFPVAAEEFARRSNCMLDLVLEGEEQTAQLLRSGEVLAAITADSTAIRGCRSRSLGVLRYVAVASPAYFKRYFPNGMDAVALSNAPMLRTDREDALQTRWAKTVLDNDILSPTHWVPSTQGFIDLIRAGLGWGMVPHPLADRYTASGELRPLDPARSLDVTLYWQYSRLFSPILRELNHAVTATARKLLFNNYKSTLAIV